MRDVARESGQAWPMMFRRWSIATLVAAACTCARVLPAAAEDSPRAAAAGSSTLPEGGLLSERGAIARAQDKGLTLLASRFDVRRSRAQILASSVLPNPEVGIGGNFLAHGGATGGTQEFSLSLSQEIPLNGAIAARQRAAESYESSAEQGFAAAAWELGADVRAAYLAVQVADARVRMLDRAHNALQQLDQIIEVRAKAGANSAYDRLRVQVELRKLDARREQARILASVSHADLSKLIADDAVGLAFSVEELPEPRLPTGSLAQHVQLAMVQPQVRAQQFRRQAAQHAAVAAQRGFVPNPRVSVGYTLALGLPFANGTDRGGMIYTGVSMPIPVFDRGQGAVDAKRLDADSDGVRSRQIELNVRHDVTTADTVYRATVGVYSTYFATAFADAARLKSIAELAYREGRGSVLELVDAYAAYVDTAAQGLELHAEALSRGLRLQRVVGPGAR
jgi:outer membrane protein, heavy metal efflux system